MLSGDLDVEPPAWECLRDVPELRPLLLTAHRHTRTLSFDQFIADVWQAAGRNAIVCEKHLEKSIFRGDFEGAKSLKKREVFS